MVIAERELWLAISRILWTYNIYSLPEEPIDLNEYEGLSGRFPVPFRVRLEPRHDRVREVLEAEDEIKL